MNAVHQSPRDAILLQSGTNEVEFIEFFLGDVSYGINVSKVQRVLALSSAEVTAVAQAPHGVLGMIHIQKKPVPLMDLKGALCLPCDPDAIDPSRQLILVTAFNKQITAFLIDGISKIHRTSWENFEPMSEKVASEGAGGYATGTVTLNENIIIILDLERLLLRLFPRAHSHPTETVRISERVGRDQVRIVYAEDSRMVRNMTANIIRTAGYQNIECFENGQDALRHLARRSKELQDQGKSLSDEIDLVLTDIEMPKMDGLTLCRRIKTELCPANPPKVVVYSSLINKEMAVKCDSVGADAQLAKPDVEQIVELIDKLCIAPAAQSR